MLYGPKFPTDVIIRADLMHQITYYRPLDKISVIFSVVWSQATLLPGFIKSAVIICCVRLTLVIIIYLVSSIFTISLSSARSRRHCKKWIAIRAYRKWFNLFDIIHCDEVIVTYFWPTASIAFLSTKCIAVLPSCLETVKRPEFTSWKSQRKFCWIADFAYTCTCIILIKISQPENKLFQCSLLS